MDSEDSEFKICTPEEIIEKTNMATLNLLPEKSKEKLSKRIDEKYVIFGCHDSIFKFKVHNENLHYIDQLHNSEKCNFIFARKNALLVVSETNITEWKEKRKNVLLKNEDEEKVNICSTLTNDQRFLVVSTNQKTVYIWDIGQGKVVREFENKGLAKSLDTFYDEDKSVHILLIGSDRKTLQLCHLQPHEREPQVENIPIFTPHWKRKNALTAISSPDNRLQVFSGYILISESEIQKSQITCTCFSVCGNSVIFGMRNGQISKFDFKTKNETILQNPNDNPVKFLKCFDPSNSYSGIKPLISSGGSCDSLDYVESNVGVIVATFGENIVTVYNDKKIFTRQISSPIIFHCSKLLVIIDTACKISTWNMETDNYLPVTNSNILEPVSLGVADYCSHKSLIGTSYTQNRSNFFDVYYLDKDSQDLEKKHRLEMGDEVVKSARFSCDGSLLALGMNSGVIKVYNVNQDYKDVHLILHEEPVQHLIFAPHKEPILISLGEEIAWWTLRHFQKTLKWKGRPNSLDILENLTMDLSSINISFWSDRKPIDGSNYLLSVIKLKDKAKYMSASNDFNSFLCIDETGKVYIMEIINPDT